MNSLDQLSELSIARSWAAIGAFDGVHIGHQSLFDRLVAGAHQAGCKAVVITFEPLPALFFKRIVGMQVLTSWHERVALINNFAVDQVIVLDFNASLAEVNALPFMEKVKKAIGVERLIMGIDSALGKDQASSTTGLKEIGRQLGFSVDVIPPVRNQQEVVSSSNIRKLLKSGNIIRANQFLGRPYTVSGKVVHGENRGHKLGIPTANLSIPDEKMLPANGVYATRAHVDGETYLAVTNIGVRPTFENPLPVPRVEPHLLDTDKMFYDCMIELEFVAYLRPEMRFPDASLLVAQIHKDIATAREILKDES